MDTSIFISCTLILSAFTFSFAGFGFGLVAVPLLALALPIKDAVAIQLPFSVLLVVINSFRYGKSIKWNVLKPLFIGASTTGGPSAVIYATARFSEARNAKGAMGLYFFATEVLIILLFSMTGLLTFELFFQSIQFTPAVLAGFLSGSYFFKNIIKRTYLIGVHFLLFIAAVMLCLK